MPGRTKNAAYITYACALAQTAPLLSRRLVTRPWRLFGECWQFVALYLGVLTGKYKDSVGQKAHRLSAWSRFM